MASCLSKADVVDGSADSDLGANHRVLKRGGRRRDQFSQRGSAQDVDSAPQIVEIASGMNYWDGQQWSPSEARFIQRTDGSFTADKVHHRVRLKGNLNRTNAVSISLPDGKVLKSTPVGIRLYDAVSGDALIIGTLNDATPTQLSDNQIIYYNAFQGACAAVVYTLDRGSFQQDVVLTSNLKPEDWGFPPATTRIQIITEFFDGNQPLRTVHPLYVENDPGIRQQRATPDLVDETLDFGEMVFGLGRAYTGVPDSGTGPMEAVVGKEFFSQDGRTFLVESVEYVAIKEGLEKLPPCGEGVFLRSKRVKAGTMASLPPCLPVEAESASLGEPIVNRTLVKAEIPKGVTVDYISTVPGSGTFRGDTTYFVSGPVTLTGASTLEAGTVFKYPNSTGTSPTTAYLQTSYALTMKTTPFRPAVFTAADDDTIGEKFTTATWSGYTGAISGRSYANPAIWMVYPSTPTLSNCRFRYTQGAIKFQGPSGYVSASVSHSQFLSCLRGIELHGTGCGSGSATGCGVSVVLNNCLMTGVTYPVQPTLSGSTYAATFYNCSVDSATQVANGSTAAIGITAHNTIFANVTSLGTGVTAGGTYNGFYGTLTPFGTSSLTASSTPFQQAGAGNYYLAAASSFRNTGSTANLPATLLADLRFRTTDPPWIMPGGTTLPAEIAPQALRDSDSIDLGYHYDVLDVLIVQGVVPNTGVPVVLTNGVAIGFAGSYGISVPENGVIVGEGKPLLMNRLVWFYAVQEQPSVPAVTTTFAAGLFDVTGATSTSGSVVKPVIQLRFTDMPTIGRTQTFFNSTAYALNLKTVTLQDCWLRGISFTTTASTQNYLPSTAPSITLWNNLIERGVVTVYNGYNATANNPLAFTLQNNTLWYSTLNLTYNDTSATLHPAWGIQDNLFDNATISFANNGSYATYVSRTYNAFFNTATSGNLGGTSALTVTALSYGTVSAVSWPWYIASSTPALVDYDTTRTGGGTGFYHYTTATGQAKEQNTSLDIGFHYIALSSNAPIDTDGDGTPDYLEDRNGNGSATVDSGETAWGSGGYNSPNGLGSATAFTVYTSLK